MEMGKGRGTCDWSRPGSGSGACSRARRRATSSVVLLKCAQQDHRWQGGTAEGGMVLAWNSYGLCRCAMVDLIDRNWEGCAACILACSSYGCHAIGSARRFWHLNNNCLWMAVCICVGCGIGGGRE